MYKLTGQAESGKVYEILLSDPLITLGRAADCQAIIDEPSVSSHHARITLEEDKVYIEDTNSRNGVLVNGEMIAEKRGIFPQDEIRLGLIKLTLENIEETVEQTVLVELPQESSGTVVLEPLSEEATTPDLQVLEDEQTAVNNAPDDESTAVGAMSEIDSNKTLLWGQKQPEFAKLFLVIPNSKGSEYPLDKAEITIGRTEDNDIIIDHPSVSRSHARIVLNETDYYLTDSGSANGTLVNGNPAQDTRLQKGDQVQIGLVKGRFIDRGEIISYQELEKSLAATDSKLKSLKTWITASPLHLAITAAGVFLLVLVVMLPLTKKSPSPVPVSDQKAEELLEQKTIDTKLALGKEYYNAQAWDKAEFVFNDLLTLDPDNEEAQNYLQQIEQERAKSAAKLVQEKKIPAKKAASEKKREKIQTASKIAPKPKAETKPAEKPAEKPVDKDKIIAAALADYQKGEISSAVEALKKTDDAEHASKIEQAQAAFNKGLEYYQNGQNVQAFNEWQQVLEIDQDLLGDKKSTFTRQISKYMADEHYKEGLTYYKKGMFQEAFGHWNTGLNLNPEHAQIKEETAKLALKAKQLYQEAYILEAANPNIARQKWQEVLTIVPPDNEYYKKAQTKLGSY
ncbi:MAG: FHA domain-containing protein [Candidatus Schekmanbacteria bacterium]|nr:FHA domain-containing protein [Candidatus Schekmanbacteria bacterium]